VPIGRAGAVALILALGACSDETRAAPDLALSPDLSAGPDLAGAGCDVIRQDCGAGFKCTLFQTGGGANASIEATCEPSSGSAAAEAPCTRTNNQLGDDDCAPGGFCSNVGWPGSLAAPMRHCNPLCHGDSDCPTLQRCVRLSTDGLSGFCVKPCDLFSGTCGTGMSCTSIVPDIDGTRSMPDDFVTCESTGAGQPGDTCTTGTDCAADLICDAQSNSCAQLCDDSGQHPCPAGPPDAGLSCMFFNATSGPGRCQ
jgi:hypothetical protein